MNTKSRLSVLPVLSVLGILALSSFFKNPTSDALVSPVPDNYDVKYHSTSKKEQQKGNLNLSTAFLNDYYTEQHDDGYFYIEIRAGKQLNSAYRRPPMNLAVVIDRSGSMGGAKIENAKKAAKHIINQLSENDFLSIIIYDEEIEVLQPQARIGNKELIKNKIDRITARGSTNLMGGAMKGYEQLNAYFRNENINRVLLLSDGLANEGITDPKQIRRIVQGKLREGSISISTFGVGNDYNEDLMTAMAENGQGNYYFISQPTDIPSIFQKELNGLMEVLAQNVYLTITLPQDVTVTEVQGYSFIQEDNLLSIKLNNIFSEETKGILLKYEITGSVLPRRIQFETNLSFRETTNNRTDNITLINTQQYTNRASLYSEYFNEWVDAQVVLYTANMKMENAMQEIDKGNYEKGRSMVKETETYISTKTKLVQSSPELQKAQQANMSYQEDIKDIEVRTESDKKYIQKANKSTNYQIRGKK